MPSLQNDDYLLEAARRRRGGQSVGVADSTNNALLAEARRRRGGQEPSRNADPVENRRRADEKPAGKIEATMMGLLSGIPGIEAMMGGISAATGGTYQGGRQHFAARQERARESISKPAFGALSLAPEVVGMALAPVTAAPRLIGTLGGRALLSGGIEATRAASRTGIDDAEVPSMGDMASSAVRGGAVGAVGSVAGEKVIGGLGRIGRLFLENKDVIPGVGRIVKAQQLAANVLRSAAGRVQQAVPMFEANVPLLGRYAFNASRPLSQMAEIIEPIGPARARRVLQEELPAPQSTLEFKDAAQQMIERANTATRQQTAAVRQAAQKKADVLSESGRARIQTARGAVTAALQQAEALRAQGVAQARQSVDAALNRLRERVPRDVPTGADELRTGIREAQTTAGNASYAQAFELADGVDFSPIARQVDNAVRRNPEVAAAYRDAFTRGGAQEAGEDVLPALDLPTFDRMRQNINERAQAFLRGDPTGIPRQRAAEAFTAIKRLEDAYVNRIRQVRGDDAANALGAARAEYAEYFRQLDALADGRNLGRFGFGKKEGRIDPSRLTLTNLERTLQNVSPEAQESFQVGAREWVNDVLRRTPDDARRVAENLVGTEERYRRAVLALGEETAADLRTVFLDNQAVRDAASRGLQVAMDAQRGVVTQAKTTAQLEANRIASEVRAGRRQIQRDRDTFLRRVTEQSPQRAEAVQARELSRQMSQAQGAVNNTDTALGFANTILPRMTPEARVSAGRVMALRIDDDIMGLMTKPNGAQLVADKFAELKNNPATSAVLGQALEEAERRLRAGVPLRRPVGAVLGSSLFAEMDRRNQELSRRN